MSESIETHDLPKEKPLISWAEFLTQVQAKGDGSVFSSMVLPNLLKATRETPGKGKKYRPAKIELAIPDEMAKDILHGYPTSTEFVPVMLYIKRDAYQEIIADLTEKEVAAHADPDVHEQGMAE